MSVYLYYIGGRLLYETVYANLKNVLPSISTLNRYVQKQESYPEQGVFDFDGVLQFLNDENLPKYIWISEDCTRITEKIKYCSKTNKFKGFPLPLRDGLPETDSYLATTGNVIESHFQTNVKAHYACVIMVQPIKYSVPACSLSVLATDNKFKAEDVTKRWAYIRQTFLDLGVTVLGFSSNGDTRYLKAMRISSELPLSSDRAHLSQWEWFHIDSMSKDCCYVQDSN
nr:unnamed protein product [Callosobruchus analis]